MAQPQPYNRQFNFADQQAQTPSAPLPGTQVDAELNSVKLTLDQTLTNLAKLQRDDGALRNGIVTKESLSPSLSIGFTLRGEWQSGVNYYLGDGVTFEGDKFYRATASALSNAGNAPDQPGAPWELVADFTAATQDAEDARDAALAAAAASQSSANNSAASAAESAASAVVSADMAASAGAVSALFTSVASASAATVPLIMTALRTSGYAAAGDGGAALYARADSEPSHAGKFQSADGAWWEIAEAEIDPKMLGAKFDWVSWASPGADDTQAWRDAISVGRPIIVPAGKSRVADRLQLNSGQMLSGAGHTATVLMVSPEFNMAASGVVRPGPIEPGGLLLDIGISFYQPVFAGMTRADLIQYPPAVDCHDLPRAVIDRVRISAAWDGIDLRGNSGGTDIGTLEVGAFNKGWQADGALDFIKVANYRFWSFGIGPGGTPDGDVWRDGLTSSIEAGRVDGLTFGNAAILRGNVTITAAADATIIPIVFQNLCLDTNAKFTARGGVAQVRGGYQSSNTLAPDAAIEISGGNITFEDFDLSYPAPRDAVIHSGGRFTWKGGRTIYYNANNRMLYSSAGRLVVRDLELTNPTAGRTVAYIEANSGHVAINHNVVDSVDANAEMIKIGLDTANVDVSSNRLNREPTKQPTHPVNKPAGPNLGIYGSNGTSAAFTPVLVFATMGDAVFTPSENLGRVYWDGHGYHYEIRYTATANAFTTASGGARLTGLPALGQGISGMPAAVGVLSQIDFTTGYSQVVANYSTSTTTDPHGHIALQQVGDNVAIADLGPTNIKPSTTISFSLRGYVRTRP